jgi:hypothetical protein
VTSRFLVLLCALVCNATPTATAQQSQRRAVPPSHRWIAGLTLRRNGSRLVLRSGRDSLELLAPTKPAVVSLSGGARLGAGRWRIAAEKPAIVRKDGTRLVIDLDKLLEAWLKSDDIWGGHANANQLRYMNKSAGGLSGELVESVAAGKKWLAIIRWHALGPSLEPVFFQHLVRIDESAAVAPIQPLTSAGQSIGESADFHLFTFRGKILLYRPGSIVSLTQEGAEASTFVELPNSVYPAALFLGRYWLLLPDSRLEDRSTYVLDVLKRKVKRVQGTAHSLQANAYARLAVADPANGVAIVAWQPISPGPADFYLIDLRKGTATLSRRPYMNRLVTRWHGLDLATIDGV